MTKGVEGLLAISAEDEIHSLRCKLENAEREIKRLAVAGDYADPRAPDQMALVLRVDVNRVLGELTWRTAQVKNYQRKAATPSLADTPGSDKGEREGEDWTILNDLGVRLGRGEVIGQTPYAVKCWQAIGRILASPLPTPGTEGAAIQGALDEIIRFTHDEKSWLARTVNAIAYKARQDYPSPAPLPSDDQEGLVKEARERLEISPRPNMDWIKSDESLIRRLADALSPAGRDQAAGGGEVDRG